MFSSWQKADVKKAQDILWSVNINPIFGKEVLFWAELKGIDVHSTKTLKSLIFELESKGKIDGVFNYGKVVTVLNDWGSKVAKYKPKGS